jgi:hypothetical protein
MKSDKLCVTLGPAASGGVYRFSVDGKWDGKVWDFDRQVVVAVTPEIKIGVPTRHLNLGDFVFSILCFTLCLLVGYYVGRNKKAG